VLSTLSVGALKSHGVRFDKSARSQLDPVLAGMTAAKMTKIFVPLRPEFFAERKIAPDTFVTIYEQRHAWLLHLRTDGKPLVTIFASGAMSDLVEKAHYADIENQMLDLLDHVGEPDLSGARNNLEGRFHITDWTTNPNFLAAYSAMLPGVKRRRVQSKVRLAPRAKFLLSHCTSVPTQLSPRMPRLAPLLRHIAFHYPKSHFLVSDQGLEGLLPSSETDR
jgi:hypothetical protein